MVRSLFKLSALFSLCLIWGCSQGSLSERDARLEQLKLQAEAKRKELQMVEGSYDGLLKQEPDIERVVDLRLEIKDIPTPVEGQVDPLMMPSLTGSLRFHLGGQGGSGDFISYPIRKADFNPNNRRVDLVLADTGENDFLIALVLNEPELKGTWSSPHVGSHGALELKRPQQ